MATTKMTLTLDDADLATIQGEIELRMLRHEAGGGTDDTLLPEGESCVSGGLIAEMVRDLEEYRSMYAADRGRAGAAPEPSA